MKTRIKTPTEVAAMREAGAMLATVLQVTAMHVAAGITTKALANVAAQELRALGGQPSFLHYRGFPDVICISINNEIVHGIPSNERPLAEGDVVGLDFGVTYRGMITDGAISVGVGTVAPKVQRLLEVTKEGLAAGIAAVHDTVRTGDIGAAIESYVYRKGSYGIPTDLVGHGIGATLWEEPNIPNVGRSGAGPMLSAGMTIAIEPMITLGTAAIQTERDGWTITTTDGSWAAHFEHTVLVTENGAEILTQVP